MSETFNREPCKLSFAECNLLPAHIAKYRVAGLPVRRFRCGVTRTQVLDSLDISSVDNKKPSRDILQRLTADKTEARTSRDIRAEHPRLERPPSGSEAY